MTNHSRIDAELRRRWGRTIASRRKALEFSQECLARLCGITTSHVSQIERGLRSPSDPIRIALAQALKCRVEDLFQYQQAS